MELLESGKISYIIVTGTTEPNSINDFIRLNTRALQLAVHEALGDIDEPQDLIEYAATLAPR